MPYYQGNISSSNSAVRVGSSTPNCYQSVQNPDPKESQERNIKQSFYSSEAPSISAEPFSLWLPNMHSSPQHTECSLGHAVSWTTTELHYTLRERLTLTPLKLFLATEKQGAPKLIL